MIASVHVPGIVAVFGTLAETPYEIALLVRGAAMTAAAVFCVLKGADYAPLRFRRGARTWIALALVIVLLHTGVFVRTFDVVGPVLGDHALVAMLTTAAISTAMLIRYRRVVRGYVRRWLARLRTDDAAIASLRTWLRLGRLNETEARPVRVYVPASRSSRAPPR